LPRRGGRLRRAPGSGEACGSWRFWWYEASRVA